jgi:hypothetical protein
VAGHAAVGVDDDLAPGQPRIAHGPTDDEAPGRVDQQRAAQLARVVEVAGQHGHHHVLPEVVAQELRLDAVAVLRRDEDALDRRRRAVAVANGDLRLAVGAQVGQPVAADDGQALGELVGQRDRQRHQLGRLARGVAEHHPLVARAGVAGRVRCAVDALGDVGRLLVDRVDDRARVGAEAQVGVDVADPADRLARDVLDVDVGRGRDLARDDDQAGVDERLAGHAAARMVGEDGVEHAVGDLVGDLVGVALGDRLGGEEELVGLGHRVTSRR